MMKILPKYLFKQHIQLLVYFLIGGCGIYLLIDIFDRLDNFIKKDFPINLIIKYFLYKIPLIIAQILPMVYLISFIVLFFIMKKKKELIALQCGGIKFFVIIILFLIYSFLWSGIEFAFSQFFGVIFEKKCDLIWNSRGKKKKKYIKDLWFRKNNNVIYIKKIDEISKEGCEIKIILQKKFKKVQKIINAKKVKFQKNKWILHEVNIFDAENFLIKKKNEMVLTHMPSLKKMVFIKKEERVEELNPWQLKRVIFSLKKSGASVEALLFIWHKKIAYAFSIFILTLFGFCLIKTFNSLFWLLSVALTVIFLLYALFNLSEHFFAKGNIPFWIAAWLANLVGLTISCIWFWVEREKIY